MDQCLENHDLTYAGHGNAARILMLADSTDDRSWYARSRSRAATCLLLTAPGIPAIFMGEEFLEDKNWSDDRGANGLIWSQGLAAPNASMRDFLRVFGTSSDCAARGPPFGRRMCAFRACRVSIA
jgi:1,4-alpha-glucan branching enzyme